MIEYVEKDRAIYHAILNFSKSNTNSYDNDKFLKNILVRTYNVKQFLFNDYIKALIYSQSFSCAI